MHSSIFITSLFAALAIASPVHQALQKKAIVYDVVTDVVTVTVTAGDLPVTVEVQKTVYVNPVAAPTTKPKPKSSKTRRPRPTTSSQAPPPPPPPPAPTTTSTTTTPPPPPPPPSTTEAPPPPPTETPQQEPEPEVIVPTQSKVVAPVAKPVSTPPPTAAGPSSSTGDKIKDVALNVHNEKRALHHVGSVSWDDALAADAATLSQKCVKGHQIYGSYGQNIYSSAVSTPNGYELDDVMRSAVEGWYEEVSDFKSYGFFGKSDVSASTPKQVLHFTQVVWKGTTKIGCAVHYCGNEGDLYGSTFYAYTVTCNYQEAGNMGGAYASNVFAA